MKIIIKLIILSVIIFLAGCSLQIDDRQDQKTSSTTITCNKEDNCCLTNGDCQYIPYTGECNTPEYVSQQQKQAQDQGIMIGESRTRTSSATCACENSQCVTHR